MTTTNPKADINQTVVDMVDVLASQKIKGEYVEGDSNLPISRWTRNEIYEAFDLLMGFSTLGARSDTWAAIIEKHPRLGSSR